jgi:hypothetical protein
MGGLYERPQAFIGPSGSGHTGMRSTIAVDVERIADSCGHAMSCMEFAGERTPLDGRRDHR